MTKIGGKALPHLGGILHLSITATMDTDPSGKPGPIIRGMSLKFCLVQKLQWCSVTANAVYCQQTRRGCKKKTS